MPDLQVLPELWPGLRSVWMGAGPVPEIWHRALNALAWLVRLRLLPSLSPLAAADVPRHATCSRWGEHRGGMFVAVDGARRQTASAIARSWHHARRRRRRAVHPLDGGGGDHPPLPRRPAARRRARAPRPTDLELADYEALFARRAIVTGVRQDRRPQPARRSTGGCSGDAWDRLPEPLRAMHELDGELTAEGRRDASSAATAWLARLVAAGDRLSASRRGCAGRGRVPHARRHASTGGAPSRGRTFRQHAGSRGRGVSSGWCANASVRSRFGLALVLDSERLRLVVRRWSVFGIPLPLALGAERQFL